MGLAFAWQATTHQSGTNSEEKRRLVVQQG